MIRKNDLVRWNLLGTKLDQMRAEVQKIIDNDPKYANVPTVIFWKYKSDGETLDILNPDYRLPNTSIAGYSSTLWLPGLSARNKSQIMKVANRIGHGYNNAKNNHLYYIHNDIITASNGSLSNDQVP